MKSINRLVPRLLFVIIFLGTFLNGLAQEGGHETQHENLKGFNRLTLGLGHTHVSEGKIDGKTRWLALASWSLNYDYWLNDHWAIGLQSDLILESFIIEHGNEEILERSYPISVVPVGIYKFNKSFAVVGGMGMEFAEGDNLGLTRLGLEYGAHLPKHWELGVALVWDYKWNFYNSWGLALTVSKIWKKHN